MRMRVTVGSVLFGQLLMALVMPLSASAAGSSVVISGLQQAGPDSATQEFIQLSNRGSESTSLLGWQIQYRAASAGADCAQGWSHKVTIGPLAVAAGGTFLLAPAGYVPSDTAFPYGLAASGTIRLLTETGAVADALAWGTAVCGTGGPAPSPPAGQSLQRRPGADGSHGDNALDFAVSGGAAALTGPPAAGSGGLAPSSASPGKLEITELFIDPTTPLSDAADEYIEIHNTGASEADLAGYVIKSGQHLGATHTLAAEIIPGGGYLALKSADTQLALANAGSSVALFAPDGTQAGATVTYSQAVGGQAWARFDSGWHWTTQPTPGAPNILTAPPATTTAAGVVKTAKAVAPPKATKAPKAPKAATAKETSAKAKAAKASAAPLVAGATTPGGRWLLYTLAALTIAYIMYEFRYDLRNLYHKFRGHPGGRPAPVPAIVGRRGNRISQRPRRG